MSSVISLIIRNCVQELKKLTKKLDAIQYLAHKWIKQLNVSILLFVKHINFLDH